MKKIEKRMHADKERVLDEVSCIDAATELGLMMKEKSGKVYLECPFHEKMIGKPDRHIGNCVISKDARRCYCYACNGSGDAIEMVMAVEGLSFCEATDWLAERRAPHLLEDENKKKTRRRKCPFSDADFSSIGIHTTDVLLPVGTSSSKYEAYNRGNGTRKFTDSAYQADGTLLLCRKARISIQDIYFDSQSAFWSIVRPKAEEACKKYREQIRSLKQNVPDNILKELCLEELQHKMETAKKFLR